MRTLLLLCFTLILAYSYAQPRVVTFGSQQEKAEPIDEIHSIKLHPFEFISGDYSAYYELALTNNISVEIGLGMTFGDEWGNTFSDNFYNSIIVDPKLGFSFAAALRFYPLEVFENFYIAPEYKFRKYRWDQEGIEYTTSIQGDKFKFEESRNHSMPRVTFGYVIYLFNDITLDFHMGIGMNIQNERLLDKEFLELKDYKIGPKPRAHGGIKLGYVF